MLAPYYDLCIACLKAFYQVRNSLNAWGATGKNGVHCATPVPIYSHSGQQSNRYKRDLDWLHFDDEPRI